MKELKDRLLLLFIIIGSLAIQPIQAMDVSVSHANFFYENEAYLEVYLHFIAGTMKADTLENNKVSVQSNVLILLKQGENIIAFEKYQLSAPASDKLRDFQDVKRFKLPAGDYVLEVITDDSHDPENRFSFKEDVSIDEAQGQMAFSDIQLMASVQNGANGAMSKNGFGYEILPYDFYDSKYETLNFYAELYLDPLQTQDLYLYTALLNEYSNSITKKVLLQSVKKIEKAAIIPLLKNFDIAKLPSGNFHVQLELRTKDGKTLTTANKDFQRSNPYVDFEALQSNDQIFESSFVHALEEEKLDYYLKAHIPIAQSAMNNVLNTIIENNDMRSKKYFIYKYWTDQSKDYAQIMFDKFMTVADAMDKMYNSGFGYGFETDRGFLYLKYGRPSQVINISDEVSTPPYEMWVYDKLQETGQTNVKFVFYNPSLATNDYILLHSTCRGEKRNPQWLTLLYSDALSEDPTGGRFDNNTVSDKIGRNAKQIWNDL